VHLAFRFIHLANFEKHTITHTNAASALHKKIASDHETAAKHHHKAAQFHDQNKVREPKIGCNRGASASFERMGFPTRLSVYGLGADAIDVVVRWPDEHGMTKLSEHGKVTLTASRRILEATR
jgi:alcohol dehydrogenase YqhD (iron-dependent ADH family)